MLNEKIRNLRKQNNLTQEELAEKLNVSRQAITKWESGAGTPDIVNIEALAKEFGVSFDELLSDSPVADGDNVSRTEFDVFGKDDFDIGFGSANTVEVTLDDLEKVVVEIRTDLADKAYRVAKVKLENGRRVDLAVLQIKLDKKYVSVETEKTISRQDAKKHLFIKVMLPKEMSGGIELSGETDTLILRGFAEPKHIEFDGRANNVRVSEVRGHIELNSNDDMELHYDGSADRLDLNQLNAVSTVYIKKDAKVNVYNVGRACTLVFDGFENAPEAERRLELNGRKAELTVRGE